MLIPGLLAAGIGTLVSIGLGSWTGLDTSDISLALLQLARLCPSRRGRFPVDGCTGSGDRPGIVVIFRLARATERVAVPRPFIALPVIGLVVAGLAIAFSEITDKGVDKVLFSGQDALAP